MTPQEINRAFHEALGKCWHSKGYCEVCGHHSCFVANPDYCADPRLVLKEMRKRKDWRCGFMVHIGFGMQEFDLNDAEDIIDLIMDTSGKLALLGIEWLKEKGR